ncbi:MAG: hypothetical protein K9N49_09920 [Candidatus Marinimicrobia bacterium]|nr:hypothetical protein [Candidatus Neomarinimicrobiota bacterium]
MSAFPAAEIRDRLSAWWAFEDSGSPCILGSVCDGPLPDTEDLARFWQDEPFVIDRAMAVINTSTYYGQAVPYHYVDQGSSAMAEVLGCPMRAVDKETVWADACLKQAQQVLDIRFDPAAPCFRRIRRLTEASCERAPGHHMVAPFALEGMTDLMAALYGLEPFLIDSLTQPDLVARCLEHLKQIWLEAWSQIQSVINTGNPGGISWVGIWAPGASFPLQEDVAYNLSPAAFERFCMPHIRDQVAAMEYPFFHVDGVGMIPHLDALLTIRELKAIQWQPGAGKEDLAQWHDLLRKILAAGKSVQVYARAAEVKPLAAALGTRGVMAVITDATHENMQALMANYRE